MSLAKLREKLSQLSAKQNQAQNEADSFTFDIAGQDTIQGITRRGNRPEDWLEYTQLLRKEVVFPSSMACHNFMCDLYEKALTEIKSDENRNNEAYARLYLGYARLKSEYIMDDAQALFSTARLYGRKLADVYIASAQFEVDNGNKSKARKMLEKGMLFEAKPTADLEEALRNLKNGSDEIYVSPVAEKRVENHDETGIDMSEPSLYTPESEPVYDVRPNTDRPAVNREAPVKEPFPIPLMTSIKPVPVKAPISVPSKFGLRTFHSTPLLNSEKQRASVVGLPMRVKKLNLPIPKVPEEQPDDADTMDSFKYLETHANGTATSGTTFGNHAHTSGYLSMTADSTIPMDTDHIDKLRDPMLETEGRERREKSPELIQHQVSMVTDDRINHHSQPDNVPVAVSQPNSVGAPDLCTPSMKGVVPPHPQIPHTPMTNMPMITVNSQQYGILRLLGKGGSSEVYQVLDSQYRVKAVKCVNLNNANEFIVEGYKNEIKLLKRLQYCNKVIKMYDFEYVAADEKLYVVMEAGSEDLASFFQSRTKDKKMLSDNLVRFYWEFMLEAVHALHREGIIHSDLKPANFLLVGGNLKLIDFGIAKALQQDKTSVILETQIGTLNYMSPEAIVDSCGDTTSGQGKPKYKISVKSDVWSLGCILYNMVYRRTPFQHLKANFFKLQAIINPDFPIEFPEILNKPLMDVIQKCLCRDPKSRPSLDELLAHPYITGADEASKVTEKPAELKNKKVEALVSNLANHYCLSPGGLRSLIHQTMDVDQLQLKGDGVIDWTYPLSPLKKEMFLDSDWSRHLSRGAPTATPDVAASTSQHVPGAAHKETKAPIRNPLKPHLLNRPQGPTSVKHMRTPLQSVNLQSLGGASQLGQPHNRHRNASGT